MCEKTNKIRVWTVVDRNRMRFAAFEVGDGTTSTFQKLWKKMKNKTTGTVCTEGNWSYSDVLSSKKINHLVSKSEACLVESYNSVLRRRSARLRRKTQAYSKSADFVSPLR
ncbi:MAG: hypothetical protein LBT03_02285 [Holosporales bacterium]|nr:hypothetical protein [Holosporales bacterium]